MHADDKLAASHNPTLPSILWRGLTCDAHMDTGKGWACPEWVAEAKAKILEWSHLYYLAVKAAETDKKAAEAKLEAVEKHNEILAAANRDYMTKLEVISQKAQKWRRRVADPLFGYPDVSARQDASAILDDIQEALLNQAP